MWKEKKGPIIVIIKNIIQYLFLFENILFYYFLLDM